MPKPGADLDLCPLAGIELQCEVGPIAVTGHGLAVLIPAKHGQVRADVALLLELDSLRLDPATQQVVGVGLHGDLLSEVDIVGDVGRQQHGAIPVLRDALFNRRRPRVHSPRRCRPNLVVRLILERPVPQRIPLLPLGGEIDGKVDPALLFPLPVRPGEFQRSVT